VQKIPGTPQQVFCELASAILPAHHEGCVESFIVLQMMGAKALGCPGTILPTDERPLQAKNKSLHVFIAFKSWADFWLAIHVYQLATCWYCPSHRRPHAKRAQELIARAHLTARVSRTRDPDCQNRYELAVRGGQRAWTISCTAPWFVLGVLGDRQLVQSARDTLQRRRNNQCCECGIHTSQVCEICHTVPFCSAACRAARAERHAEECNKYRTMDRIDSLHSLCISPRGLPA
jgi:hypothetical protein